MSVDDAGLLFAQFCGLLFACMRPCASKFTVKKREELKIATQFHPDNFGILVKSTADILYRQLK